MTSSGAFSRHQLGIRGPAEIAPGPDGNMWFTETNAGRIGRITTSGQVLEFRIPTANAGPLGIASGPDGRIWFTEQSANRIGRLDPGQGDLAAVPTASTWALVVMAVGIAWVAVSALSD